jgi:hypothetical protein
MEPFTPAEWSAAYDAAVRLSGQLYINPALASDLGRDDPDAWRRSQVFMRALRILDRNFPPGEWERRVGTPPPAGSPNGGSKIRSTVKSRRRKLKKGKKHRTRRAY